MSITLPPLPDNLISVSHGPFKPSLYDEGENYCVRCYTRSIYLASRQCDPHIDPGALRARDLEVARLVLEAAADFMKMEGFGGYAIAIRALEVRHHE